MDVIDTFYDNLRGAILSRAIRDYKIALRHKDPAGIASLERFFRSDYGQLLSGDNGEYIIEKVQEWLEEERRKRRRNGRHKMD